ncbi:MAG: DNA polymerase III subunit gamma/tau [Gammaproteobacteria bacterium]|nr:DNA polymerase III subunit gamma/tau [Gammaproteobacteria bacterium]
MSYLALARKWRPKLFSEVVGQAHVVSALTNALTHQRVHHAFLFSGTRGVGKTTLARIFAKALNCETGIRAEPCGNCTACNGVDGGNFIDLIEVDAASRTRVDDTRELLDNVQYTPTQGRFKIYLIDEVHMLSTHSFNALLKTLEEPPEHVKFLLATTNPQKLPTTILSRCIQFNLKAVDIGGIAAQLEKILVAEEIPHESSALTRISRSARGSVRDALSLLDQAIAFSNGDVSEQRVRAMLGMIDNRFILQLLTHILQGEGDLLLSTVSGMAEQAVDYAGALNELISMLHNLALFQVSPVSVEWKGVDTEELGMLAGNTDPESVQLLYQIALMGKRDLDYAPDARSGFEMTLVRMLAFNPGASPGSVKPPNQTAAGHPGERKETAPADAVENRKPADRPEASPGAPGAAGPGQPVPVSAPRVTVSAEDFKQLLDQDAWHRFIEGAGLNAVLKEVLMNAVPESVHDRIICLVLNESSRYLCNGKRVKQIETHFREKLDLDLHLKVDIRDLSREDSGIETPTQSIARKKQQDRDQARQQFTRDPDVREIVDLFDAEIAGDSIQPA